MLAVQTAASLPPPSALEALEYAKRYEEAVKREAEVPVYLPDGRAVSWAPQEGSQTLFLSCPIFEVLLEGTRGPGKTDALIMDFAQHVGQGYGAAWRGILFRQTYPQLADVVAKTRKWFRLIYGNRAKFNEASMTWKWDTGEELLLRHMKRPQDYWNYHGHEYPWIGFEELTNWADDQCYKSMFSCCRSSTPGVPRKIRATTNPYGVGHNWVKMRWRLPDFRFKPILDAKDSEGRPEPARIAIHGHISENKILLKANPDYIQIVAAAARNEAERAAWLEGRWDIVAGGMFDDVWFKYKKFIVLPEITVPPSYRLDRSFDWGSSRPFSVGWWAESDGSDLTLPDGKRLSMVRGDIIRFREWYGWTGRPNQGLNMLARDIAKGIIDREQMWGIHGRVWPGPADSSIFDDENGNSISRDMEAPVRLSNGAVVKGVSWEKADKSPGSRKQGWEQMRKMFAATARLGQPREERGMFVTENCDQFLRTIPGLPRDEKDLDDVDTDAEDHIADEARYRARLERRIVRSGATTGLGGRPR